MAEKGYFFNAMPDNNFETGYDRNYSADDISNWLRVAFTTGVVKTDNEAGTGNPLGLKVVADSGMNIKVNAGFACINGKPYINDAQLPITLATAPTGSTARNDCIILRMDNTQTKSGRRTYIYVKSLNRTPTLSDLTRNDEIYELLLAYIIVNPNVTSISQSYIKDKRGDETYCPWFTAVKGYEDYYDAIVQQFEYNGTMASAGRVVTTNLASSLYNDKYSLIEVYCNGLKEENTAYSVSVSGGYIVINFTAQKSQGAKISVVLNNFIDGEGLGTAIAGYNQWVNDVANLMTANEYTYVCNGVDDNIQITNLGRAWLNGGSDYGSKRIKVVGNFGWSAMAHGDGSSSNPYRLFNFAGDFNRRLILDFSDCSQLQINAPSGKYSVVFPAQSLQVFGANISIGNTDENTMVKIFSNSSGEIYCENCRFWINAYKSSNIASCGTFKNCRGSVANIDGNSYCFQPADASLLRIEGGEYYAYTSDNSRTSAILGQSSTNSVSILYAVNAPTQARSGYYQKNSIWQVGNAGWVCCTDLVSELPLSVVSGKSNIRGTIVLSKGGQM